MQWWQETDDDTYEVDDDRDLEGGGGIHVELGDVGGVGQTGLSGVTQTVSVKCDRAPAPVTLTLPGRVNWNIWKLLLIRIEIKKDYLS